MLCRDCGENNAHPDTSTSYPRCKECTLVLALSFIGKLTTANSVIMIAIIIYLLGMYYATR